MMLRRPQNCFSLSPLAGLRHRRLSRAFSSIASIPITSTSSSIVGINIILAVSLNLINGHTGQFSLGHAGFMAVGAYTAAAITSASWDHSYFR